ncbi:MAG: DUF3971 domain-containing protein [Rhodospirillaceae bacterium]
MVRRAVKGLIQLLGGLGAGIAIVISLLAWQLSKGPVSLGFLTEYLERAVNVGHRDFKLELGDTILTWAGWERALDIRVLNVNIRSNNGATIGSVPEVAFSLSGSALIAGKIAPQSVEFYGPRVSIRRERDGTIDVGFGVEATTGSAGITQNFLDRLMAAPSLDHPMSFLSRVAIIGGAVTVNDQLLRKKWRLPVADVRLVRLADRLKGELNLVLDEGGHNTELVADGAYIFAGREVRLDFRFSDVAPAVFASLATDLAPLQVLDMPFSGTIGVAFPIDGDIKAVNVDITGKDGRLRLPKPFQQEIAVAEAKLRARFRAASGVEVESLDMRFAEGIELRLPKPVDFPEPIRALSFAGTLSGDARDLSVTRLVIDGAGPVLTLSGELKGLGDKDKPARGTAKGTVDRMSAEALPTYWPTAVAPDPRAWVTTHIRKGLVTDVGFQAEFTLGDEGAFNLLALDGTMKATGAEVEYLPPMPKVVGAAATMRFDKQSFTIYAEGGKSNGLEIEGGRIVLSGLDQYDQFADIDLQIKGGLGAKLAYIDNEPFKYTSALNLDLRKAAGRADTRLKLFFILEKDLKFDQVKVWARSKLADVSIGNIFLGRGIDGGQLDVRIDVHGMDVKGDVRVADIPAHLSWRENFNKKVNFRSQYKLHAKITDVRHVRDLGLDMEPFSGNYIKGGVTSDITYTVFPGHDRRLEVKADIKEAALSAPAFGWSKPVGVAGSAEVVVDLGGKVVIDIPRFLLKAADLDVQGKAKYALDGTGLERIEFARIAYGRTSIKGALIPKSDGGWEAGFHGPSFDLSPLWQEVMADDSGAETDHPLLDKLTLVVEFDRVWIDQQQSLYDVSGTFARAGNLWKTVMLTSRIDADSTFDLSIRPRDDGNRDFTMRSDDAGSVLKVLGLYPNMVGGKLLITGAYDDAKPNQPLTGTITVNDYRVINAPALAHLVSIMSLTGILDALQGDGLAFRDLVIPFELARGVFNLKNAKATGNSLGFTATGKVYRHTDIVDLEGTVIPAYVINSAFGRIPVLGDLFTGGEKGGGVFAATYTMTGPLHDPVVAVNPLSALTPGFLRNVFGIFSRTDTPTDKPGDGTKAPRAQ